MFLNPMDRQASHAGQGAGDYTEYVAVDIGGLIDWPHFNAMIQAAAAKLPANKRLKAGENWGYYIQVHVTEGSAQAVLVRPYPYRTWGW